MLAIAPFHLLDLPWINQTWWGELKKGEKGLQLGPEKIMHTRLYNQVLQFSRDYFDLMSTISKIISVGWVHSIQFSLLSITPW